MRGGIDLVGVKLNDMGILVFVRNFILIIIFSYKAGIAFNLFVRFIVLLLSYNVWSDLDKQVDVDYPIAIQSTMRKLLAIDNLKPPPSYIRNP